MEFCRDIGERIAHRHLVFAVYCCLLLAGWYRLYFASGIKTRLTSSDGLAGKALSFFFFFVLWLGLVVFTIVRRYTDKNRVVCHSI